MGTISYIIILFNNSELFTKISISLIIILFSYITLISIRMYINIKNEEKTLLNLNSILNNNKNINEKISINNKTTSYKIYISGLNEFMHLYKKGVNDITIITLSVKEAMKSEMLKKQIYTNKIKLIKDLLIYTNILYFFLSFILFFEKESIIISQNLNILNLIIMLNELFLPIIISVIVLTKIKIIENMFANLNFKIYNKQKIFIKNFLILLYNKFYE
ncbi:MAG TPA: hypothetical protein ACYCC7_00850 [Candidatus Azoamicus sp. MARI]